jgi:peptide/nickel transport system substrate-binding protein
VRVLVALFPISLLLAACGAPASSPSSKAADTTPASATAAEQAKLFPQDGVPQYGGQLRLARLDDTKSLNFIVPTTTYTMIAVNGVYESLVNLDWRSSYASYGTGIAPGIAKSWEMSPDGTTWTFRLQEKAKWHDGDPVTSADVKATYEHQLNYKEAAPPARSYIQPYVASIETPDPKTVVLKLKGPTPVLLNNLAVHWAMIVPKKSIDRGMDYMTNNAIGSGPFKYVHDTWQRGVSYEWVKNPDYWDEGVPFLDGKKMYIIPDRGAQIAAFETKKIDDTWEGSPKQAESLQKKYGDKLNVVKIGGVAFPHVQINASHPPFDNAKVRKALYLWWDRQEFLDKSGEGAGELGEWMNAGVFKSPSGEPYGSTLEDLVKNNPAFKPDKTAARQQAKQLLQEAGVNPQGMKVNIVVENAADEVVRGGQVLAQQLRQLGFDAQFQAMEQVAAQDAQLKGNFDVTFRSGTLPYQAPDGMLSRYIGPKGTRNYAHYEDPTYDRMLAELDKTVELKRRGELLNAFDKYLQTGEYPVQLSYWFQYTITRWEYNKGRKYLQVAGHQPDDRAWLGLDAPGRGR